MPADNSTMSTILMLVVMMGAFWLLLIRPAQKKQREQQELVSSLQAGTRVMTTAGVFGTIRHLGERQAIVEIAPGVEMTLLKTAILRAVPATEEEFEYDDEVVDELDAPVVEGDPAEEPLERPADPDKTN